MISQRQSRDLQTLARLRASEKRHAVAAVLCDVVAQSLSVHDADEARFVRELAELLEVDDE